MISNILFSLPKGHKPLNTQTGKPSLANNRKSLYQDCFVSSNKISFMKIPDLNGFHEVGKILLTNKEICNGKVIEKKIPAKIMSDLKPLNKLRGYCVVLDEKILGEAKIAKHLDLEYIKVTDFNIKEGHENNDELRNGLLQAITEESFKASCGGKIGLHLTEFNGCIPALDSFLKSGLKFYDPKNLSMDVPAELSKLQQNQCMHLSEESRWAWGRKMVESPVLYKAEEGDYKVGEAFLTHKETGRGLTAEIMSNDYAERYHLILNNNKFGNRKIENKELGIMRIAKHIDKAYETDDDFCSFVFIGDLYTKSGKYKNNEFESGGPNLIFQAIKKSIELEYEGKVKLLATEGTAGFYYLMGFRSCHPDILSNETIYEELSRLNKKYDGKSKLPGILMCLPERSIKEWREIIKEVDTLDKRPDKVEAICNLFNSLKNRLFNLENHKSF